MSEAVLKQSVMLLLTYIGFAQAILKVDCITFLGTLCVLKLHLFVLKNEKKSHYVGYHQSRVLLTQFCFFFFGGGV